MTTTARAPASTEFPALESGDRMSRAEFHRRYSCRPDLKKAELIDGVVYVASPVRVREHGQPHAVLIGELHIYRKSRPGLIVSDNGTWIMDDGNEVQPDIVLCRTRTVGGGCWIDEEGYLQGVPEFVAEVSGSSFAIDMNRKRDLYRRAGVREYLVWQTEDDEFYWWRLQDGDWAAIEPDAEGVLHSTVFEGLSLKPAELIALARDQD
jgi:Uma2 family endonuclease